MEKSATFFSNIILFNALIPISLYVSMEMVKLMQVYFLNRDLSMYDPESGRFAEARTSSLNEDLGQVGYLFTDKTGTLTNNKMIFRKVSIDGVGYTVKNEKPGDHLYDPNDRPFQSITSSASSFLLAIALCHTCTIENQPIISSVPTFPNDARTIGRSHVLDINEQVEENYIYQSSSPDEVALVSGARNLQYIFTKRASNSIHIKTPHQESQYKVLTMIEFTSTRKRMSTIYEYTNGDIYLFCKGADEVMISLLAPMERGRVFDKTMENLSRFASDGLRILVYCWKKLDRTRYKEWAVKYAAASVSTVERTEKMEVVAGEIEKDLSLLGVTAIEGIYIIL